MEDLVVPLSALSEGQRGTVVGLAGGIAFQNRIVSMGMPLGCEVEVLQNGTPHRGPTLVAVGETRLAIGHGMAEKILVAIDPQKKESS